jgi:reactive intermediate/imine deaminase
VVAGGFFFSAGQIPLDPATSELVEGGIAEQTERVLQSLGAVLEAAGSSFDRVVKTTCFLADLDDFAGFNAVYAATSATTRRPAAPSRSQNCRRAPSSRWSASPSSDRECRTIRSARRPLSRRVRPA